MTVRFIKTAIEGLSVRINEDGVFLQFDSGEKHALINLEYVAHGRGPIARQAILGWCEKVRRG